MSAASRADLAAAFDAQETVGEDVDPSWNVAPTDPVRIVAKRRPHGAQEGDPVRQLRTARWGLIPSWSKTVKGAARMINARVETVTSKPTFRSAVLRRRCLCPADGYYEWQQTGGGKVPHYLRDTDRGLLAFAGVYELWRDPDADQDADSGEGWLWSCAVLTRPATDVLGHIHDRCPLIVPAGLQERWLDCAGNDAAEVRGLLEKSPTPISNPSWSHRRSGTYATTAPSSSNPSPRSRRSA